MWDREKQNECNARWRAKNPSYHAEKQRLRRATPRGKFTDARQTARRRGVEWLLTFEEWWAVWEPHFDKRGRSGLLMCRIEEPGPYSVDNVYIGTHSQNRVDRYRNARKQEESNGTD